MDVRVSKKVLSGEIAAISSKSHAHRILIAAALSGEHVDVVISDTSDDIDATRDCLKQLNAVSPVFNCHESGSTLRFLLPLSMALKRKAVFTGTGGLPYRPLSPLREQMEEHGCVFTQGDGNICTVEGSLTGGKFTFPGNVSPQFITGMLFALPLLSESSEILLSSPLQSASNVTMTLQVLELFGVKIEVLYDEGSTEESYTAFRIKGSQRYVPPGRITIEGDWSNAAFWLAAGAVSPSPDAKVTCRGLDPFSSQGDRKITSIIKAFGGSISKASGGIGASPGMLRGIEIDAANIPDLIPAIAVIASVSSGTTQILNAERLRIKENDRLHALYASLTELGADIRELPDSLIINGMRELKGGTVSGCNDHRIVMAMAVAALRCKEPVVIKGAEAISKSYPHFFDDFKKLGGEVSVV
ncbi:MAG: 3-phosphoshikimate 1-carboxyvinyltransferase [Clostridiales bacterium]|nr:3-phosphoshikimate 1-carboxyvinyltransferase [Clostridiales bacterium]